MRSLFYCALFLLSSITFSQDVGAKTLVSQSRTTIANIGRCEITIKYHSPSVNGRKIFGGIVPFDFVVEGKEYPWRAGSNQRTTIEFSHPVELEGHRLEPGSYGLVALVSEKEWILIFSSGKSWGAFNYDKTNDIIRIPVQTETRPFQEWLSYEFENPTSETVDIVLRWENTAVSFNLKTDSYSNIISDLNKKEQKDANDYQELAIRTLEREPDQKKKVLEYLEKSFNLLDTIQNENLKAYYLFNYRVLKGEVLIEQGNTKEGNGLLQDAWKDASGFNIYYYGLYKQQVEGKSEEALEILKKGVEMYPENFQNHFALGEYYLKEKNQKKATEHFKKAYELAQEQNSWVNYARYLYLQNKLSLERR